MNIPQMKKQVRQAVGTGVAHAMSIVFGEIGDNGLNRLTENLGELRAAVIETVTRKARELSILNQFANEEVPSNYGYHSGYKPNPTLEENLKDMERELQILRTHFPELAESDYNRQFMDKIRRGEVRLPKGSERWTLVPRWQKIAEVYVGSVQKVLDKINKTRNGAFHNYREGQVDEIHLRELARSQKFFRELSEAQWNPDILIVAAQFGLRHRGRSVRRAREVFLTNEFGLGAFANGIMLLTHPKRLQHYDDLWIDCAGDEFDDPGADVRFARAPYFLFGDGMVGFDTDWFGSAYEYFGSASAFIPQK